MAASALPVLEAYDLTESFHDAGDLAGCSHHTVARYVRAGEDGWLRARQRLVEGFLPKL